MVREFAEETGLNVDVLNPRDALSAVTPKSVHNNAVIFDVRITGGHLRPEVNGTTDHVQWVEPADIKGQPMTPFVSAALGWSTPQSAPVPDGDKTSQGPRPTPPRRAKRGRRRRGQRFGAYGLVTDPEGRVLLARISEGYPGGGSWHLPGGGVDFGEQPREALTREISEETAQCAEIHELMDVTSFRHRRAVGPEGYPLDWHGVRAIYRATVGNPCPARVVEASGGSTSDAKWWERAELPGLEASPALSDALRLAEDLAWWARGA